MKKIGTSFLLFALIGTNCSALTLQNAIEETFSVDHGILSNKYNTQAQEKAFEEKKSSYYPSVDLSNDTQRSNRKNDYKDSATDKTNIDGNKAVLSVEQLLYDGGKTTSIVNEAESNYWSSVYDANAKNNEVILKVIKSYLQLSSFSEIESVLNYNKKAHNTALSIANNNEQISGELLETKKVLSMVSTLEDKIISNTNQKDESKNEFTKHTKIEKIDFLCRPTINESLVPKTLDEFLAVVLANNPKIKEQEKNLQKQSEKINQVLSRYQPNLKLKVEGIHDNDIELAEKGTQQEVVGKVVLNWNFYSGGGDDLSLQKEKLLQIKEKEILEKLKVDEIEKVKNIYSNYFSTKDRIANLKKTLAMDMDILRITNQQLEDGTRTFFDVLNAKSKLYDTQMNLIKQEHKFIENYFSLILEMGHLSDFIQNSSKDSCLSKVVEDLSIDKKGLNTQKTSKNKSEEDLLQKSVGGLVDNDNSANTSKKITQLKKESKNSFENDFEELFKKSGLEYNVNDLSSSMKFTPDLFTVKAINQSDKDAATLDALLNNLVELISMHNGAISDIEIELHTSLDNSAIENQKLSQRRAEKVKKYLLEKFSENNINSKLINISTIGKGSEELIFKNGVEDKESSKRVVVKLLKK